MKTKIFAAALAALALGAALPAAAQDFRVGEPYGRGGYDAPGRAPITVRNNSGRYFNFDRNDRAFGMFVSRPYNFRPGLTYVYSNRCDRRGCLVTVLSQRNHHVVDRFFAAPLPRWMDASWRDGRDGRDRWDDANGRRDDNDGRWDDNDRDHRGGERGRNGDQLEGGPYSR